MNLTKRICAQLLSAGICLGLSAGLQAQTGTGALIFGTPGAGLRYQPALLHAAGAYGIWTSGMYAAALQPVPLGELLSLEGVLETADKDRLMGYLGGENRLHIGQGWSAGGWGRIGRVPLSLDFSRMQLTSLRFGAPHTLGLVLYGNARYAGQTLEDAEMHLLRQAWNEIAAGTAGAADSGRLAWGLRAKVLIGTQADSWESVSYSLLTAADGRQIDLRGAYTRFRLPEGQGGTGAGIDAGLHWNPDGPWQAGISATDLGFIRWRGTVYDNEVDLSYAGFDAAELFADGFPDGEELSDTLRMLLYPDSMAGGYRTVLPGLVQAQIGYELGERAAVQAGIIQGLGRYSATGARPVVWAAYVRQLGPVQLAAHAGAGGIDGLRLGLAGQGNIRIGAYGLTWFASADQVLGGVLPGRGRGLAVQGGIAFAAGK
ncbi:MAG: DUF5723 family protein [Bacteroidia bacterium]|nr:DUF5723 family protein [Bacteroidia bacterium]